MSSSFSSQWELKETPESTHQVGPTAAREKFLLPPPGMSSLLQHCVLDTAGHGSVVRGCIRGSVWTLSQGMYCTAPRTISLSSQSSQSHQPVLEQVPEPSACLGAGPTAISLSSGRSQSHHPVLRRPQWSKLCPSAECFQVQVAFLLCFTKCF